MRSRRTFGRVVSYWLRCWRVVSTIEIALNGLLLCFLTKTLHIVGSSVVCSFLIKITAQLHVQCHSDLSCVLCLIYLTIPCFVLPTHTHTHSHTTHTIWTLSFLLFLWYSSCRLFLQFVSSKAFIPKLQLKLLATARTRQHQHQPQQKQRQQQQQKLTVIWPNYYKSWKATWSHC